MYTLAESMPKIRTRKHTNISYTIFGENTQIFRIHFLEKIHKYFIYFLGILLCLRYAQEDTDVGWLRLVGSLKL